MLKVTRQVPALVLSSLLFTAPAAAQAPSAAPQAAAEALALARKGQSAEAWRAWERLPNGEAKLRAGIDVAAALGEISRGLQVYEQLRETTKSVAVEALHPLALSVAAALSTDSDPRMDETLRVIACNGALVLDKTHEPCVKALETMATDGAAAGRAFALYALADAGLRPFPALFKTYEPSLGTQMRLMMADRFRRLPSSERLALVAPLLNNPDVAVQYQTLLALGNIDHPGAGLAVSGFDATVSGLRQAKMVALAQHGNRASLDQAAQILEYLDNSLKVAVGVALVRAGDERGTVAIASVLTSPVDVDRLRAAEAAAQLNVPAAQPVILDTITAGSPVIRPMALQVAGIARLGANRAVYSRLTSSDAQERALAVSAIAATGLSPAAEGTPVPAPAPRP